MCAYQRVRNVRFLENLTCFVFFLQPFWNSPFSFIVTSSALWRKKIKNILCPIFAFKLKKLINLTTQHKYYLVKLALSVLIVFIVNFEQVLFCCVVLCFLLKCVQRCYLVFHDFWMVRWMNFWKNCEEKKQLQKHPLNVFYKKGVLNPIQDGPFRGCSRIWGPKRLYLPKICYTYPSMMKLDTLIPYLKKIKKLYESRDTLFEFCWHQHFLTENHEILLYQEIQV